MSKLIGIKWGALSEETKTDLLERAFYEGTGEVIVDLTENLSVAGTVIDTEEERYLEIDDEAIIYNPEEGVILEGKESLDTSIDEVMTVNEAAEIWNKSEGAIRASIKAKKFILGIDYRKAGRITLISREAMERVYGKK